MFSVKKPNPVEPEMLFKTLSDPTRLRLLNLLAEEDVCVCDLHSTLGLDQPKVSRHLGQLRRAGLVETERDGKWMHYRLARQGDPLVRNVLEGLRAWMRQHPRLNSERGRLEKVCCQNDKTKGRQRKTS
jgi:ArsR family transcriptional regulator, arsenate/arsenite/antimonite-responsive transcriptional repressor